MYLSDVPTHLICWIVLQNGQETSKWRVLRPRTNMLFYVQLNRFGRRIPHSVMMMTGGFTCLMVLAVGKEGRYNCLSLHWSFHGKWIIFQYLPVFHGVVPHRDQAQLPGVTATVPMVIFGSPTVAAGLVSLFLPETLFNQTFQTVEEINRGKEFYGVVWMEKPRPFPLPCARSAEPDDQTTSLQARL